MFLLSITNFQKVKYFNLIFDIPRNSQPLCDMCHTNPMLVKSRLNLIENTSKDLTESIKNKKYDDILLSISNILYAVLGTSDVFGYNIDIKLDYQNIYQLIIKYGIDLLSYIDNKFNRTRFDIVFAKDTQLLYQIHLDYCVEVQNLRTVIQNHEYDKIIDKLVILNDFCYVMAYLFGFDMDIVFELIHQSNMNKLADNEEIAKKSVEKYLTFGYTGHVPKYRKVKFKGIYFEKFIIFDNCTGNILDPINYIPINLDNFINNPVQLEINKNKILPLLAPSYLCLNNSEKRFVASIVDAFNCGYDLIFYQKSHIGLMMKKLLIQIFLTFRFDFDFILEDIESWDYFIKYFCGFIISFGFYDHSTNLKIKPEFTKKYWHKLIEHPALNLQSFDNWYTAVLDRYLFNDKYRYNNTISNNLYLGITPHEAEQYYSSKDSLYHNIKPELLFGINTRLTKNTSNIIYEESYMKYCSNALDKIIDKLNIIKTMDYCSNNKDDVEMINSLILHLKTGSLKDFNDYLIKYISRRSNIEWVLGFLDFTCDILKRKGYFSGILYLPEKNELLFTLGPFKNNSSLIPIMSKYILEQYPNKILQFTNTQHFTINPLFLSDTENKIRKINQSFSAFLVNTIKNFNTIDSLPFFKNEKKL
uniref:Uncharacterized protein n=1 Tax=viral metagenome TaxID=1070528 RepID=A0A6C0E6H0_9ZZZZ